MVVIPFLDGESGLGEAERTVQASAASQRAWSRRRGAQSSAPSTCVRRVAPRLLRSRGRTLQQEEGVVVASR